MADRGLLAEIEQKLAFQQKWRRVMSGSYFTVTALALASSAAATVVAALGHGTLGSILAGGATALFGMEKTLLLREKWARHLNSAAQLEALEVELRFGGLGQKEAALRLATVLIEYAGRLPLGPLDGQLLRGGEPHGQPLSDGKADSVPAGGQRDADDRLGSNQG